MPIVSLYRYPVKGLSAERLPTIAVQAGEGFPLDRKFALLRTQAEFDPAAPQWLAKANFLMLMVHEQLATLQTHYSAMANTLQIRSPDGREQIFQLGDSSGRTALEAFFQTLLPGQLPTRPRLIEASGHMFTDKAAKFVSLINLASVRELERRWGESLDPMRFRANVYIDGVEPFSELDWVGQQIKLGSVLMQVVQRNGRCAATNVNPETGERDRNIPGKLREEFGHKDLGVYLKVLQHGKLHEGDPIIADTSLTGPHPTPSALSATPQQLICTACYYLFDPQVLNSNWHAARDLPPSWRCPDCGSTREAVRSAS